jgi:hypothetical protein
MAVGRRVFDLVADSYQIEHDAYIAPEVPARERRRRRSSSSKSSVGARVVTGSRNSR